MKNNRKQFAFALATFLAVATLAEAQGGIGYWYGRLLTAGGGTATYTPSGAIETNTTQAGTTAVITEETLWTYSLPANTLNADGKGVRVTTWGVFGATANVKTIRLYFGATVLVIQASTGNGVAWKWSGIALRSGASAQVGFGEAWSNAAGLFNVTSTTPAEATAGAIVIRLSGQNGTAAANDIVFRGAIVEVVR